MHPASPTVNSSSYGRTGRSVPWHPTEKSCAKQDSRQEHIADQQGAAALRWQRFLRPLVLARLYFLLSGGRYNVLRFRAGGHASHADRSRTCCRDERTWKKFVRNIKAMGQGGSLVELLHCLAKPSLLRGVEGEPGKNRSGSRHQGQVFGG